MKRKRMFSSIRSVSKKFVTFSSWTLILNVMYFFFATIGSFFLLAGTNLPSNLAQLLAGVFVTALGASFLTSTVVRYVILPEKPHRWGTSQASVLVSQSNDAQFLYSFPRHRNLADVASTRICLHAFWNPYWLGICSFRIPIRSIWRRLLCLFVHRSSVAKSSIVHHDACFGNLTIIRRCMVCFRVSNIQHLHWWLLVNCLVLANRSI